MTDCYGQREVLAFLRRAKEHPEDDTPRLVLADWLEDHGDTDRAAFIRLQCRLAEETVVPLLPEERSDLVRRTRELLDLWGGAWLGPLWRWGGVWHRGLLALRQNHRGEPAEATALLPWADSALFEVTGRGAF